MSWINLKIDVKVNASESESRKDILNAIRKGIYRGLDDKGVSTLDVHVSVDFLEKEKLYYMTTDLGKRSRVELFYEESLNLKPAGHEFYVHSYMLGTEQGCGYIDYEIRCLLEEANEQGMYQDNWTQVYESFEDLPMVEQIKVAECIDERMSVGEQLIALDSIGIAADPSLDGSVGSFRIK